MGNIVGETLRSYVINQINARQTLHGSGVFKPSPGSTVTSDPNLSSIIENSYRTDKQLHILNSNTSWIKLASGVYLEGDDGLNRLKQIGFTNDEAQNLLGDNLAKNYILHGGTSKWQQENGYVTTTQRQGFLENYDPNSSYIYSYTPITLSDGTQVKGADFGYSPMPGIISAEIKSLNRGSLEKAFIKIRANDRRQLDILDVLYMRLGYTVLLEWGNSLYTSTGTDNQNVRQTLIEKQFFQVGKNRSYFDFLGYGGTQLIDQERANYDGNYDGMLAVISNFSWTFNPDGTYDIDLTLISMGDVVESLKSNISIDAQLRSFIDLAPELQNDPSGSSDSPVEKNKDANIITSALWLFKRFGPNLSQPVKIVLGNGTERKVGNLLKNGPAEISTYSNVYNFYVRKGIKEGGQSGGFNTYTIGKITDKGKLEPGSPPSQTINSSFPDDDADKLLKDIYYDQAEKGDAPPTTSPEPTQISGNSHAIKIDLKDKYTTSITSTSTTGTGGTSSDYERSLGTTIVAKWVKGSSTVTGTVTNPIDNASFDDACIINNTTPQYYLRFGYLLQFLTEKVIPLIKGSNDQPPLFSIDYHTWSNHMYSLPNQISLDPRVCIVKNPEFQKASGTAQVFLNLRKFKEDINKNAAYPMNVYLNFEFIISSLESNTNERGDVNIYGLISSICNGVNKALGGINNLEPIIDKEENVLRIIEGTPVPGYSNPGTNLYELNLFGYQKSGQNNGLNQYTSTFIRKVDLKTAITPEYATMVTVGATANGYVKGTEATAFSRWNKGIIDRFKDELVSPNSSTTAQTGGKDEAEYNYGNDFLSKITQCYGYNGDLWNSDNPGDIDTNIVEKNLSVVTEFYKYIIAKAGQKSQQAGTIGFIPFKLGITMDGISGIKIYNKLEVNSRFLPTRYGETLNFIITGINHRLQDNDWETNLETIVMPKTTAIDKLDIDFTTIKETGGGGGGTGTCDANWSSFGSLGTTGLISANNPKAKTISQLDAIVQKAADAIDAVAAVYDSKDPSTAAAIRYNKDFRLRIVKAAASYIGQPEIVDNQGFCDPIFEQKMKDAGWWKGAMWCALFARRVYKDAYFSGNAYLSAPSGDYELKFKNLWPTKLKNGDLVATTGFGITNNFATLNRATKLSTAKAGKSLVLPGDIIRSDIGHTEIVVDVTVDNKGKLTNLGAIAGNCSQKVCYQPNRGFGAIGVKHGQSQYDFAQAILT